jgi:hypothetical protein
VQHCLILRCLLVCTTLVLLLLARAICCRLVLLLASARRFGWAHGADTILSLNGTHQNVIDVVAVIRVAADANPPAAAAAATAAETQILVDKSDRDDCRNGLTCGHVTYAVICTSALQQQPGTSYLICSCTASHSSSSHPPGNAL